MFSGIKDIFLFSLTNTGFIQWYTFVELRAHRPLSKPSVGLMGWELWDLCRGLVEIVVMFKSIGTSEMECAY